MATASTTTVIDHTSDAGFRTWAAEQIAQITAAGLTATADTGQINTTTATRPGTNTNGGYSIFRFNDTLHATVPIFIRFDWGTGSAATTPRILVTTGSGSNGSGTITGAYHLPRLLNCGVHASTITSYVSRWVYNSTLGFFGMAWKLSSINTDSIQALCFIGRTSDSNGDPTGTGVYFVSTSNDGTNAGAAGNACQQMHNIASGLRYPIDGNMTSQGHNCLLWVHNQTSTQVGSDTYVTPAFYATPGVDSHRDWGLVLRGEVPSNSTFSVALKGATSRTYISLGMTGNGGVTPTGLTGTLNSANYFMLWE